MSVVNAIPLIAAGDDGYSISRSLRLRQSASAYLNRTNSVAPTSNQKGTFSFWFKRGLLSYGTEQWLFSCTATNRMGMYIPTLDQIGIEYFNGLYLVTSQVFRDPAAWYHFVLAIDSTQTTASNRVKMYINGTQVTSFVTEQYPAQNAIFDWMANGQVCYINQIFAGGRYFDGYMAEFNYIDGQQLAPSSFGAFSIYNQWLPKKYAGTYGTNGFYLPFTNNASTTTLGYDFSPQGNNWTTNNISVTAGSTYDSMTDVPTLTSATAANFAVLNPLAPSSYVTISAGNLTATGNTATNSGMAVASIGVSSGKYAWEETITTVSGNFPGVGATTAILQDGNGQNPAASNTQGVYYRANGTVYKNSASLVGTYATFSNGDVVRFELDADALTCAIYKNNTLIVTVTGLTAGTFFPSNVNYNSSVTNSNFGQRPFANTPNTGYLALNTFNL